MGRTSMVPSASAPVLSANESRRQLDRTRMERLLARAELGDGEAPKRPPGGAPFKIAPSVRATPQHRLSSGVSLPRNASEERMGASRTATLGLRASERRSTPTAPPMAATGTARASGLHRTQTPSTRRAGAYVKSLLGDYDGQGGMEWRLVEEMDAIDGLLKDNKDRKCILEKRTRQKDELDSQVQLSRHKDDDHRQSMSRWRDRLEADADLFKEEQMRKKDKCMILNRKFQDDQSMLIDDLRRRRQEEQQLQDKLAADMISHDKELASKQHAVDEKKKRFAQQVALEIADAARASMIQKAEQKRQDHLNDIQLMKMQAAILEERDLERQRNRDNTMAKQKRMQEVYQSGAGNRVAQLQQKEEIRAKLCMDERIKKEEEAHHEKIRRLKQLAKDGRDFVAKQLDEQREQRVREREENLHRRELSDRDAESAMIEHRLKEHRRKEKERANAEFLMLQISQKHQTAGHQSTEQMTDIERSINKDRLERARDTDKLQILFKSKQMQFAKATLAV